MSKSPWKTLYESALRGSLALREGRMRDEIREAAKRLLHLALSCGLGWEEIADELQAAEERGRREMQRDAIRVAIEQPPEYWVAGEVIAAAIRNLPDKASR